MNCIDAMAGQSFWQCPRCGTARHGRSGGPVETFTPKLVERCRKLVNQASPALKRELHRLGILESVGIKHELER